MLDNPGVNGWYENVAWGGMVASQEWFGRMGFIVSEQFKVTPAQLAKMDKNTPRTFFWTSLALERSNGPISIVRCDSGGAAIAAPLVKTLPCVIVNEVGMRDLYGRLTNFTQMKDRPIEESLSFLLVQLVRAHHHGIADTLRELGLYVGQEMIMSQLWEKEGVAQSELADACGLEKPTITKVIERMSEAGLIRVEKDQKDRRVRRVYLTERGKSLKGEYVSVGISSKSSSSRASAKRTRVPFASSLRG